MLVRLLLTVLTLVGIVPVRICTCSGTHEHIHPLFTFASKPDQPPGETPAGVNALADCEHHCDCKPRPTMSEGTPQVLGSTIADDIRTLAVCTLLEPRCEDGLTKIPAHRAGRPPTSSQGRIARCVLQI